MKDRLKGIISRETDNWKTPINIYNAFIENGFIDTFPFMAEYDEFKNDYHDQKLFVNPPFSKMKDVVKWVIRQYQNNNIIALLIPVRTDTKYFHELIIKIPYSRIYFIKGRLKYNDGSTGAPFPTMLVYINNKLWLNECGTFYVIEQTELLNTIIFHERYLKL